MKKLVKNELVIEGGNVDFLHGARPSIRPSHLPDLDAIDAENHRLDVAEGLATGPQGLKFMRHVGPGQDGEALVKYVQQSALSPWVIYANRTGVWMTESALISSEDDIQELARTLGKAIVDYKLLKKA